MIQIVADTLSCITVEKAKQLNIPLLPQMIIFGEETYRDDTEIDTATFLKKLQVAKQLPKTAAPSPALYIPIFKEIINRGDVPFVLCPTAELSGTYRSAVIASKEFPGKPIRIMDTRTLGAGLGVLVTKAIQWAQEGNTAEEIEKKCVKLANQEKIYFIVNTLEFLQKGGRIGGAKAFIGSILKIKPILKMQDGTIQPAGSQRTKKKVIDYIFKLIEEDCPKHPSAFLSVMHGGIEEEAKQFAKKVSDITGIKDIPLYEIPAAILVHGGPGTMGISFFSKPE